MTLKSYLQAMPKVDVYVQLEGALRKSVLLMIAEQNNMPETVKRYTDWLAQIDKPDYRRLNDLIRMMSSWLQIADDVKRIAYDMGVSMHHQNIRYAEVGIMPTLYEGLGLSIEALFEALNDGRDRAQRGWGVDIGWILNVGREEPRKADDYVRFASSPAGQNAHVVAVGITGKEDAQPVGQFERAFKNAEKKELARVVRAGDVQMGEGILGAMNSLAPNRIIDARGLANSPEALQRAADSKVGIALSLTRALRADWVADTADIPLHRLYDEDVLITLASDMPSLYRTTLADEYLLAVEKCGLSIEEAETLALNGVRMSFLPDERKSLMLTQFQEEYAVLRAEHLEAQSA